MERRPYTVENGMLEGPLYQPGDLYGIADVDGFCEWVNDIYEMGFKAGEQSTKGEIK